MNSKPPRISIIIPCFNHGNYIAETLSSIEGIADRTLYEVIIVNDGSTDQNTASVLEDLGRTGRCRVIFQENQGVCRTRNNALALARGEYILPVDSDNLIKPEFVYKAIEILDDRPDVSIVYSDSILFGEEEGVRIAGPFNLQRLMLNNFIDNCSVYRKSMTDRIGGYDPFDGIAGIEDWELWLRAAFHGYKFHYINEPLFYYRILPGSLAHKLNANKIRSENNVAYFEEKHEYFWGPRFVDQYFISKFKSNPIGFLGKIMLKIYFPKRFAGLVAKGKLRKYL
jgi:glycosyltransferase involved in cell wall biosynthesis